MTNPEMPRLLMKVGPSKRLEHIAQWGEEMMQHYAFGTEVEVKVYQKRSKQRHALYWVMVYDIVANSEGWASAEHFHAATKIELGYTQKIKMIGEGPGNVLLRSAKYCLGKLSLFSDSIPVIREWVDKLVTIIFQLEEYVSDTITLPGSIAFDKMDEAEFKVFFDRAKAAWTKAGIDVSAFEKEANNKIKPYYGANYGRGKAPRSRDNGAKEEAA